MPDNWKTEKNIKLQKIAVVDLQSTDFIRELLFCKYL